MRAGEAEDQTTDLLINTDGSIRDNIKLKLMFLWQHAEDKMRCLAVWGKKLLCSLMAQQWIRLYHQTEAEQLAYN